MSGERLELGVDDIEGVFDVVELWLRVAVREGVGVSVEDGVRVAVCERVGEGVGEELCVWDWLCVCVGLGVIGTTVTPR